jgi:hypothetical protein
MEINGHVGIYFARAIIGVFTRRFITTVSCYFQDSILQHGYILGKEEKQDLGRSTALKMLELKF